MAPQPPSRRLDALTGIRPFASLAVFFFHFGRPLVGDAPPWLRSLAGSGYVAVSFFYVLSGFVLTLGHRRALATRQFDARRFFARRLARVLPAAALALLLLLPLALHAPWGRATGAFPAGGPPVAATGLLHLLFLQAWLPSLALTWNLPAWSVSVELAFYLAFPFVARALLRTTVHRRWCAFAGAWAVSLALAGAYALVAPDGAGVGPDSHAPFIDALKFWPPLRLPEFICGVALGTLFERERRVSRALGPVALVAIAVTLANADRLPYAVVHNALLIPAFGALLVAVASVRGRVAAFLGSAPLVRLGRAGYTIYILQMPLMYLVLLAGHAGLVRWSGAGFVARFAALVLGTALLVHRYVEPPVQRWLERVLGRSSVPNKSPARHFGIVTQRR